MTPKPHLLIRADAGGTHGLGHVMRMLALGQAWIDQGGKVSFACACCPEAMQDRLLEEGIVAVHSVHTQQPGDEEDITQTQALLDSLEANCVGLDGYHFGTAYQAALWKPGRPLLVMDDYGHCDSWAADIVLNHNLGAEDRAHHHLNASGISLLGPCYALMRREFIAHRDLPGEPRNSDAPCRVLLTLGGVDPHNDTARILEALRSLHRPKLELRIIVGGANPYAEPIRERTAVLPFPTQVVFDVRDMPSQYEWADAVITGGGGSCFEWLLLGLPALLIVLADNQEPTVSWLEQHALATRLPNRRPEDAASWPAMIESWLGARKETDPASIGLDGHGAERVARVLLSQLNPASPTPLTQHG